jgi:thymidylate kinase
VIWTPVVAIEGPVCAGKTTLGNNLMAFPQLRGWTVIPDFADVVGGRTGMPDPAPTRIDDELRAVHALLEIDASRCRALDGVDRQIILDRSVLTIAAHAAGLVAAEVLPAAALTEVEKLLEQDRRSVWPTYVIYLDVNINTQLVRNCGKFDPDSIFINPMLNRGFREWHRNLADAGGSPAYLWLDGDADKFDLAEAAAGQIARWMEA